MSLLTELKRRNVIRIGLFYIVSSWLLLQLAVCRAQGVIDYHVHYFSPAVVAAIESSGFRFSESDYQFKPGPDYYDLERLLENNDAGTLVLLSGGFNYRGLEESSFHSAVMKENDRLAVAAHMHPKRLRGFCGLDPLASRAVVEAERCLTDLGLDGIKLHLPISGFDVKNPEHQAGLRALLDVTATHAAPVLIHNATQSAEGAEYARIFVEAMLGGQPSPVTVIFAHAGGPSTLGPFHFEFLPVLGDYLVNTDHRIYFELSGILRSDDANETERREFAELVRTIGIDHFLFGSDYPARSTSRHIESLRRFLPVSDDELMTMLSHDIWSFQ